jgi:hypothetical protein
MPVSTDRTPIRTARAAFATARRTVITALDAVATAEAALKDAERKYAEGRPELDAARQALNGPEGAVAAANAARANEKARRTALHATLTAWANPSITVDDDFTRMFAHSPLVLFPVRIETRFGTRTDVTPPQPVLRVRIYPDEIFINLHEPALTREEYAAAVEYYQGRDGGVETLELWRRITRQMSAERAAYVLRIMTPTFGGGTSGTSGGTSGTSGGGGPQFPTDILLRASDFTRPAEAILPDRWIVRTIRGSVAKDHIGNPIPEPLTMTADPAQKPDTELFTVAGSDPVLKVDDEIAWTVDFTRAKDQGMAVQIDLVGDEALPAPAGGFDRILVFGVKTSMEPVETAALMEQLFDSHHYTRGLALVPQGTPTNNTEGVPTPLPRNDPDGALTFAEERNPPPASRTEALRALPDNLPDEDPADPNANPPKPDGSSDAAVLARMLGIHNSVFANIAGARAQEQWRALQMAKLVWPTTLGYFIEQLMRPALNEFHHNITRAFFLGNVRARGPAPAFRIGQVPYGVLPALSVRRWGQRALSSAESYSAMIQDGILRLREAWRTARVGSTGSPPLPPGIPIVSASSTEPLTDLFRVLSLHPSSREIRVRSASGPINSYDLINMAGGSAGGIIGAILAAVKDIFSNIGAPSWATNTELSKVTFIGNAKTTTIPLLLPDADLREDTPLPPAFFDNIAGIGPLTSPGGLVSSAALLDDATLNVGNNALKNTAFYKVVRNSLLWALIRATVVRLNQILPEPIDSRMKEAIVSFVPVLTFRQILLDNWDTPSRVSDTAVVRDEFVAKSTYDAFKTLKTTPTAELDRLFSETLDVVSHRLDAWITAFATSRLLEMRAIQKETSPASVARGSYLGGYAFVENVRPVARNPRNVPGFGAADTQAGNGGFIQAPSISHAATAAVLRNGYISYKEDDPASYAFDLTSARVRAAREIMDEVRAGQPLGAALGYRLERAIQDRFPALNQFRYALRKHYPLVANKAGTPNPPPADVVAARNVVDGLAVWRAYNPLATPPFPTAPDLPPVGSANYNTLVNEIKALGEIIDGVSDLTVGESILQVMKGDPAGASGNLDSLSRGARPPDPELAVSKRGGIPATHRAALVFAQSAPPTATGWTAPQSPRSDADRLLDAWAGAVLGDPGAVSAKVTLKTSAGVESIVNVTLANLNMRPIDFVALARSGAVANAGSILDRRIATFALAANPNRLLVGIDYTVAAGAFSFPAAIEVARTLGALLGGARAMSGDDLVTPTDAPARRIAMASSDNGAAAEVELRLSPLSDAFATRLDALRVVDPTDAQLRAALTGAADFIPDAFPTPGATSDELKAGAAVALAELDRRDRAANDVPAPTVPGAQAALVAITARLKAFLGSDFLALPQVTPPNASELDQSFNARGTLLDLDPQTDDDGSATLQRFVQQAAQVYDGVGRWRMLSLYLGALRGDVARIDIAQLPHRPNTKWIGLKFGTGTPPLPGSVSLLLHSFGAAPLPRTDVWRGIMFEDWVEVIPNKTEQTGLAFHYDDPGAEAGQAVLIVPPSTAGTFHKPIDLWATLGETLDLAKIRAVDLQLIPLGQLLPTIFLEQNTENATVSTAWIVEAATGT